MPLGGFARGEEFSTKEPSNQVTGTARVKRGLAEMLKGGVIMDVVTADQARIAEEAGRRRHGAGAGAGRHPDPGRGGAHERPRAGPPDHGRRVDPGHGQGLHRPLRRGPGAPGYGVDYVDESEVLPRRPTRPTTSTSGSSPCRSCAGRPTWARPCAGSPRARHDPLQGEGLAPATIEAVRHMRAIAGGIRRLAGLREDELRPPRSRPPYDLVTARWPPRRLAGGAVHRRRDRHPGSTRP